MLAEKTLTPPLWINQPQQLVELAQALAMHTRLAVDTESNSLHAYREQVCLIQFSTPDRDYLVDPLVLTDLGSLESIFTDLKIEKIFHAAEYDLICLRRDFGIRVANIFDTMHAARVLGYAAVGLDKLLAEKFNIHVDKRHQKADWAARPLTKEQIHYARLDTHYLPDLREVLEQELRDAGRWELAQEDFQRASHPEMTRSVADKNAIHRFIGRRDISDRELTILNELSQWRESIAEKMNRPLFKILSNEILIALAREAPTHLVDLAGIGLSQRQIQLWGEMLLTAIRRGSVAPFIERKGTTRPDEAIQARLEKLKTWRKKTAQEMGVESDIVLPRPYLSVLAERKLKDLSELASLMSESPWRLKKFGEQIMTVVGG